MGLAAIKKMLKMAKSSDFNLLAIEAIVLIKTLLTAYQRALFLKIRHFPYLLKSNVSVLCEHHKPDAVQLRFRYQKRFVIREKKRPFKAPANWM